MNGSGAIVWAKPLMALWLAALAWTSCPNGRFPEDAPFRGKLLFFERVFRGPHSQVESYARFQVWRVRDGRLAKEAERVVPTDGLPLIDRPWLSPDGRSVVVLRGHWPRFEIVLLSLGRRGRLQRLSVGAYYHHSWSSPWSPRGRHLLAFRHQGPPGNESTLEIIDVRTRRRTEVAERVVTAEWSHGGSVVYSQLLRRGRPVSSREYGVSPRPPGLVRAFFAIPAAGGSPRPLRPEDVDRRLGPAYRRALAVKQEVAGSSSRETEGAEPPVLLSPRGNRALVGDLEPEPVPFDTSRIGVAAPPDMAESYPRAYGVVGRTGLRLRFTVGHTGFEPLRWSWDERWIYGSYDEDGKVFLAVDSSTGKKHALRLPKEVRGTLADVLEPVDSVLLERLRSPQSDSPSRSLRSRTASPGNGNRHPP